NHLHDDQHAGQSNTKIQKLIEQDPCSGSGFHVPPFDLFDHWGVTRGTRLPFAAFLPLAATSNWYACNVNTRARTSRRADCCPACCLAADSHVARLKATRPR